MRTLLLGATQPSRAIAFDLLRDPDNEVVLADNDPDRLEDILSWLDDPRVDVEPIDPSERDECRAAMEDIDVAIATLPSEMLVDVTEDAITAGTHLVDLGGSRSVIQDQLELDAAAKDAGLTIVPECGLTPGLSVLLASDAAARLTRVDSLRIRVGGLPQKPQGELEYMLTEDIGRLLDHYSEPPVALRNGELLSLEPLEDVEKINFPEPYGELEAFNTAGGLSTLPQSLGHKVENMDHKTIRYPGHAAKLRAFYDLGLFDLEPRALSDGREVVPRELLAHMIESTCDYPEADVVLLRVVAQGLKNNVPLSVRTQIIDRFDKENGITAMMRLTAYPAAIIASMIVRGEIEEQGVVPIERCVPIDLFRSELKHRDVQLEEVVKVIE
jgi:lysine 6-dehydrogenase